MFLSSFGEVPFPLLYLYSVQYDRKNAKIWAKKLFVGVSFNTCTYIDILYALPDAEQSSMNYHIYKRHDHHLLHPCCLHTYYYHCYD